MKRQSMAILKAICLAVAFFAFCAAAGLWTPRPILGDEITTDAKLGPVSVRLELSPAKPVIGDAVTLKIVVSAEKGVELLMPEFGEALDRFTILDYTSGDQLDDQGRTISTQQYRLQPPISGKQSIPPILVEFVDRRPGKRPAPKDQDAYEILTKRLDFEVASVLPENALAEIKPPLGKIEPRRQSATATWPWAVGLAAVGGVIAAAFLVHFWRKRRRRISAYEIAHARLEKLLARGKPSLEQVDWFFVELSGVVRRYLEDRFDLRAPELTTEEFLETASGSPELSQDHQVLLRSFLRQADLVKFAGVQPTDQDIEASISAARRFLEETRENAPLMDEAPDQAVEETAKSTKASLEKRSAEEANV